MAWHFVQFMHSAREMDPRIERRDHATFRQGHTRKILEIQASTRPCIEGPDVDQPILFHGEWEGPVLRTRLLVGDPVRAAYAPHRAPCSDYSGGDWAGPDRILNTDPMAFGRRMRYTCCQQFTRKNLATNVGIPTGLNALLPGSVVMFGSRIGYEFALDTMFVVRERVAHYTNGERDSLPVDDWYRDATLHALDALDESCRWSLYDGVAPEDAASGPFSYVPCRPIDGSPSRPTIRLPGIVNPILSQGRKMNPHDSLSDVDRLWESATKQVLAQGYLLGHHLAVPAELPAESFA